YQDLDELARVAGELANKLRGEGYLLHVRSVFQIDKPQLNVQTDRSAHERAHIPRVAGELANKLRGEGYLLQVRSVFQIDKPQLNVSMDRDRAAALGVSIEEISRTMQTLVGGLDLSRVH